MFAKLAVVNVTNRCNHACVFCSEGHTHDDEYVPLETVRRLVIRLRDKGYDAVNFMGAETTLRPDVVELFEMVRGLGLKLAMATNGTRFRSAEFTEQVFPLLANIEVSVPAGDRDTYKAITGRDHLERVLEGIGRMGRVSRTMDEPAVITVNTVVSRLNTDGPATVARRLADIDMGPLRMLHLVRARPVGRNAEGELSLGLEACADSFREGIRLARAAGIPTMFRGLPTCCLFDEVAHNFWTLEALSKPDNTYLNRAPIEEGADIDARARLDRKGNRYISACMGCELQTLCPGLTDQTPNDPCIGPPDPCPLADEVAEVLRGGPLARYVL